MTKFPKKALSTLNQQLTLFTIPTILIPLLHPQSPLFCRLQLLLIRNSIMRHSHPTFLHLGTSLCTCNIISGGIVLESISHDGSTIGSINIPKFKFVSSHGGLTPCLVLPEASVGYSIPGVIEGIGPEFAIDNLLIVAFC